MTITVMQMIDSLALGGAERVAVLLANGLARRGVRSHLVATRRFGPLEEAVEAGVSVWCAGKRHTLDLRCLWRVARYMDAHGIDVVHSHKHECSYTARMSRWIARRKPLHVVHDHSGGGATGRKLAFLDWLLLRHVDLYLSVTEGLHERARSLLGLPEGRCLYLRNGVEVSAAGAPWSGPPTVVQVANVHPRKDYETAARAAAILRKGRPDISWLVIGAVNDPAYAERVRNLAEGLGLSDGFRLLGAQTDVRSLLRKGHVGVLSSVGEGLPLSVLEYMAEGLPVVMTDVGQAPAILQRAKAGVVVPTRDPKALAEAVAGLLADPDRRRAMGENGRRLVAAEYSVDTMVDRVAALYEERLRARGARTHGKG
jgi:glycosyltransferase involved in cell wall biosynthesis